MHLLNPAPFGRILPAMVTPMKADGTVDFEAAQSLAKQLVADGADGLVVNGTTGESPVTHMEEKVELVRAVKEVVDVPVISGAGSNDTAHTVRMVEQTQEAGADAVLVVMPYYSRPSQDGVVGHYKAVDSVAERPIIVYDVPGRTGLKVRVETYDRLAELEHVKAVKDATGDLAAAVEKQQRTGLAWYSGDDGLFLPFLSIGAVGIISVIAHVASSPMRQLVEAFDHGDIHQAQRLANQLAPLVHALNGDGYQAVMAKASLRIKGYLSSTAMRLPNIGPDADQLAKAEEGMKAAGLLWPGHTGLARDAPGLRHRPTPGTAVPVADATGLGGHGRAVADNVVSVTQTEAKKQKTNREWHKNNKRRTIHAGPVPVARRAAADPRIATPATPARSRARPPLPSRTTS